MVKKEGIGPAGEKVWRPLSVQKVGIFTSPEVGLNRVGSYIGRFLETPGERQPTIRRDLKIGANACVSVGLRTVLCERIANEVGLRVAAVFIAVELVDRVLADSCCHNVSPQGVSIGELRELLAISPPIVGRSQQSDRCQLIVGVRLAPELIALEREAEGAGADLGVGKRIPSDRRRIDDFGCTRTTMW